jgi:hypothetical protein
MKIAKTMFIVCLLLVSMVVGSMPITKASNQDSYGYTYKDSNTVGGPAYNWIEISGTGNVITDTWWYAASYEVDLGFSFNYYGAYYDQLNIGCYGLLSTGTQYPTFNMSMNPNGEFITNTPNMHGFLAPFYGFLSPRLDDQTGNFVNSVYVQTLGEAPNRLFVVEWLDVRSANWSDWNNVMDTTPDSGITFEAILNESSSNILFQYKDVEFGASCPSPEANNGGKATVGIEDPSGIMGVQYSYNQPVITDGLAILYSYPATVSKADLFVSLNAPASIERVRVMSYVLSYGNLGGSSTSAVLSANLSSGMNFVIFLSASDDGTYDYDTGLVTWNIASVDGYPSGYGSRTVTVEVPDLTIGTSILTTAEITTVSDESSYDNNVASISTVVTGLNLPPSVSLQSPWNIGMDVAGTPIIRAQSPTTFKYDDLYATGVDISIHLSDNGPDITGTMTGPYPTWAYTLTFGSRAGDAVAVFTAHHIESSDVVVAAHLEVQRIDPAGYIYESETLQRVSGATVWLQMPNGRGGWVNVPTGGDIPIGDPDVNPLITGENGRYQWDTLPGTYRVHVEAPGYYPADSITVTVPPPVTDLHVGLVKIPLPQDNSSPDVQPISAPLDPIQVHTPVGFSASFTDSDTLDTHSAVWSWSDGHTSKGIVTEANGEGTVTGSRTYASAGVYTEIVTLTVSDSNGGSSEISTQQYIVVYDPDAGFVTGGGWINSPAGAFPAYPTLTGKANFGFVSKYVKGANVPTGNTEFDFKAATLNFHSTSYDWLVVGGNAKAQYKGTGTINGMGNYGFMLTAIDGQIKGHGASDTFRIKIWDIQTSTTVYDNQMGTSDSSDPTTTISGGNIIIHK